ncbi:CBL-interacting protein kinase 29-like [Zingiber officinale]|uniref:non-specific serine/threonine protein kinase n=1 Tax=Zingiber officinale TaxID=94328 RepID=A0A8J5FUR1_ZINOF|nr:CBL-interacting protein kinase 29-like [Zingiber officinale]KAG6490841.1 hypothetical protein ZIOFF_052156 [Zingiber officinale]
MADSNIGDQAPTKVIFGIYNMGRLLGRGSSAKVYHARHLPSGQSVAIKVFPKPRRLAGSPSASADPFIREISALRRLRHRHIVRLHEVLASRSKVYLVLDLAKGGELFSRVEEHGRLPEDLVRRLFRQLISGVAYSHSRGVFHRDLKPENILLDEAGDIKVSDFGFAALRSSDGDHLLRTQCGTPAYVSPEILMGKKSNGYDGAKADIWSCGVILFVLVAGYLPFNDPNIMSLYRKIYCGHHRCPRWTPPDLRRLIARLLDPNPATRISIDCILRDPWFAKDLDANQMAALMRPLADEQKPQYRDAGSELNAFDLIAFSPGLDLSSFFVEGETSDRERFASSDPADRVLDQVERVGKGEGFVVRMEEDQKGMPTAAVVERQSGELIVRVEVHRLPGGMAVVELEKGGGVAGIFCNEKLRPALCGPPGSCL